MWLTLAPCVARKIAAASLPVIAALCMRQLPEEEMWWLVGIKWVMTKGTHKHFIKCKMFDTIGVWCIRIAPSLYKPCCEAVLVKWGSIHNRSFILKRVHGGVRGHSDVLQGQPQCSAAFVIFQLQVQSKQEKKRKQESYKTLLQKGNKKGTILHQECRGNYLHVQNSNLLNSIQCILFYQNTWKNSG